MKAPERINLLRDKLGICQWFHFQDYQAVERTLALIDELKLRNLRTGISWADYYRPGGKQWYDWQMKQVARLDVLLSIWHTPPSIAEGGACNGPPKRLRDYADFIDLVFNDYGDAFNHLELWNEPNNRLKWNFLEHDPQWRKFGQMVRDAAHWAKQCGGRTVLGGMIPVDHHWLALMHDNGVLEHVDVIGIHGFPGMWFPHNPNWDWHDKWQGWASKIDYIRAHAGGRPIWVTETGVATWDLAHHREAKYDLQVKLLREAAAAPAERVYWYQMIDLDPAREAIEGFHVDENEYHLGLVKHDGHRKHAFGEMKSLLSPNGPEAEPRSFDKPTGGRRPCHNGSA
ncbi:MAG TPA: hypothetical protein VGR35_10445 [Tepidisphaeraceae bacterium]|nr:hypothetical protein [Tepidisphaeraceae bacterium]